MANVEPTAISFIHINRDGETVNPFVNQPPKRCCARVIISLADETRSEPLRSVINLAQEICDAVGQVWDRINESPVGELFQATIDVLGIMTTIQLIHSWMSKGDEGGWRETAGLVFLTALRLFKFTIFLAVCGAYSLAKIAQSIGRVPVLNVVINLMGLSLLNLFYHAFTGLHHYSKLQEVKLQIKENEKKIKNWEAAADAFDAALKIQKLFPKDHEIELNMMCRQLQCELGRAPQVTKQEAEKWEKDLRAEVGELAIEHKIEYVELKMDHEMRLCEHEIAKYKAIKADLEIARAKHLVSVANEINNFAFGILVILGVVLAVAGVGAGILALSGWPMIALGLCVATFWVVKCVYLGANKQPKTLQVEAPPQPEHSLIMFQELIARNARSRAASSAKL